MSVFGRFEDAQLFISATTDPKLKAFLAFAFTTAVMRRGMDPNLSPAFEFDMRFFLEAARAIFADEQAVRAILDGRQDELRWWPEEDA